MPKSEEICKPWLVYLPHNALTEEVSVNGYCLITASIRGVDYANLRVEIRNEQPILLTSITTEGEAVDAPACLVNLSCWEHERAVAKLASEIASIRQTRLKFFEEYGWLQFSEVTRSVEGSDSVDVMLANKFGNRIYNAVAREAGWRERMVVIKLGLSAPQWVTEALDDPQTEQDFLVLRDMVYAHANNAMFDPAFGGWYDGKM